jgi:YfiH family protein
MNPLHPKILVDGTQVLESGLLASRRFSHAFSTRIGPGGQSFDLARPGESFLGTSNQTLLDHLARFSRLLRSDAPEVATARQVHGTAMVDGARAGAAEADIVVSTSSDRAVAVRTADCVPILIACPKTRIVAAVHAGWRGLVADAPGRAVWHLASLGADRKDLLAAIGPAIGLDRFEIGSEVADEFESSGLGSCIRIGSPRPHADLFNAALRRLLAAGIPIASIDGAPCCTSADPRFFSHRAESGRTGRHLSGIIGGKSPIDEGE